MFRFKDWIRYCIFLFASSSLYALTTLTVTLNTDNDPGGFGEIGDLRYCLNSMNQALNTIPDDYAIVFVAPMTIQLNGILPIINNSSNPVNITIGNPGSTITVTIDGNSGAYSGFFIPIGNVTIQNMNFQNLTAKGGNGGDGLAAGGGGMGAGGAIYAPQSFLNGMNPSITLMNVSINNCSAVGGHGGNYFGLSATGDEGGGGGGGFSGNGGSITTTGITGGAGGGGFGGDGGDVTLAFGNPFGGGGGGGGGLGSRATLGTPTNLGTGGSDQNIGLTGNGYGLTITAGSGGGGNSGGSNAGGGGGGAGSPLSGGGGGGSLGSNGTPPQGNIPPLKKNALLAKNKLPGRSTGHKSSVIHSESKLKGATLHVINAQSSGGNGGDGAGGGGGGVVTTTTTNSVDGQAGTGGYGGGGGGGAGTGAYDTAYTVQGGSGGLGGGGGGGGVNQSGQTPADGGSSLGGGGGGGGGPSNGLNASGGSDTGNLGGGAGGAGANTYGIGSGGGGGGGGGGGSGLGGAIFVDSGLNFTIQALPGVSTTFNTTNNTTQAGIHGTGGPGGSDGSDGSALGNSIFLRTNSALTLMAQNANDLLTLGTQVAFTDDTTLGAGGTNVFVKGNGTVIYNGTTNYQGGVTVNNANFEVNGLIDQASISICRNSSFSSQRGTLSGTGTLTGNVFVNSGTISPSTGGTLTLGSLILSSAQPMYGTPGSLVNIAINSGGTSLVAVTGAASLAGTLQIALDPSATRGQYTLLTSSGITGTFDSVTFTGATPNYTLSYLPIGSPTYVQFNFLGYPTVEIPATVNGAPVLNPAIVCCGRPVILGPLPVSGTGPTTYTVSNQTGNVSCQIGQTSSQTYLRMRGKNGSCTIVGTKNGVSSNPLTVIAPS